MTESELAEIPLVPNLAVVEDTATATSTDPDSTAAPPVHCTERHLLSTSDGAGEIVSPGYPTSNYPNDLKCEWLLTAPEGQIVEVEVKDMTVSGEKFLKIDCYLQCQRRTTIDENYCCCCCDEVKLPEVLWFLVPWMSFFLLFLG